MHDIGRTQTEQGYQELSGGAYESNEYPGAGETFEQSAYEALGAEAPLNEWAGEYQEYGPAEYQESQEYQEYAPEAGFPAEYQEYPQEMQEAGEFGQSGELSEEVLAAEFLEITTEEELDRFLGKLIRGATRAVGKFARSPLGRMVGGALRGVAKYALPLAGKAVGTVFGGPIGGMVGGQLGSFAGQAIGGGGAGGFDPMKLASMVGGGGFDPAKLASMIGGGGFDPAKLASMAGRAFGLQFEGVSSEDREWEVARRFVRLATDAAQQAAVNPPGPNPQADARQIVIDTVRRHAPGLLQLVSGYWQAAPATNGSSPVPVPFPGTGPLAGPGRPGAPRRASRGVWVRRGRTVVLFGV